MCESNNYSITVTLGPASSTVETWRALVSAGASGFRLNTSHLTLSDLSGWLDRIERFFATNGFSLPVILDLQGSKWRLGTFQALELAGGSQVELVCATTTDRPGVLPVPHPDFFTAAAFSNGSILLNDAKVQLCVESSSSDKMQARVVRGGPVSRNKGITYASSTFRKEGLGEKDLGILTQTAGMDFLRYAVSYVRDAEEMKSFRDQVDDLVPQRKRPFLIAKLERQPAVDRAYEMAAWVDEMWLCRGDLGAELGIAGMAEAAYRFTQQVRSLPVPSVLAGQVLEHMVASPTPTRSEIYTIYDALQSGYKGFVLSDEAAVGRFPVESCAAAAMFRA